MKPWKTLGEFDAHAQLPYNGTLLSRRLFFRDCDGWSITGATGEPLLILRSYCRLPMMISQSGFLNGLTCWQQRSVKNQLGIIEIKGLKTSHFKESKTAP